MWLVGVYNMVFLLGVMAVFLSWAEPLIAVFTSDPVVLALGADCLRIVSYGYGFYAWGMVLVQAFNGAGDTRTPTWINLGCYWCFQIPLALRAGPRARATGRTESSGRSRSPSRRWRSSACWPSAAGRGSGRWREGQRRMSRTWLATTRSATS